jgi:hypothetical protein
MMPSNYKQTTILSSLYLAPVEYYASLYRSELVVIEINDNYQKQSYRNRCTIASANGPISLSIPIVKPDKDKSRMKDIRIADHANWRHLHWNAILSAYSSTPYFQYFEDDFRPFYERKIEFLHDFNEELRQLICRFIGIESKVSYTETYINEEIEGYIDLREKIHPKKESDFKTEPYYQIFASKYGFINNLSILDLLFNMGNEARLHL